MRLFRPLFAAAKAISPVNKYLYNAAGYNKLGLLGDDLCFDFDPHVKEALRRLPEEVRNERVYRLKRAIHCSTVHQLLPESEWTKPEEDIPYLQPLIEEVIREEEEKANWGKDD